jgi:hypothetical protein
VTNGVYSGGIGVGKPLALRSVNGPQSTVINGGGTNQCAFLTDGASLTGFTLTNGFPGYLSVGGGVQCASRNAFLTNCILTGNSAQGYDGDDGDGGYGGGACGGTLYNCTLSGNSALCGGGAYYSTLYNCTLTGNSAEYGGGAEECTLYNCTLTGNSATNGSGGAYYSTFYNCIAYFNTATNGANYDIYSTLNYCCTTPTPTNGIGNVTLPPLFVDYVNGNLRLQTNSPCINAGNNAYVTSTTDLDGNPRTVSGTVDIGAYEYQGPGSVISYAWLQQYGLPTDGTADFAHADGDGMNNWQEWVCGTCPTNPLSALRLLSAAPAGTNVTVAWESVARVNYFLERSANLAAPFTFVATNIFGQPDTTTYEDSNATGAGPFYYRVGVNCP